MNSSYVVVTIQNGVALEVMEKPYTLDGLKECEALKADLYKMGGEVTIKRKVKR